MQCPVSTAIFEVEVDNNTQNVQNDKFGRKMVTYKINGAD